MMQTASRALPRLILHFDVNKTIIISDKAGGKKLEDTVQSILTQTTWGVIHNNPPASIPLDHPNREIFRWHPTVPSPVSQSPSTDLISFGDFIDEYIYPYEEIKAGDTPTQIKERNSQIRKKQNAITNFYTNVGFPGHCYRPHYDKLLAALQSDAVHTSPHSFAVAKNGGFHFILPSFFDLIVELQKRGRDFDIIFRTFGDDIPEVAEEFNEFCEGRHPMFLHVRLDGTNGSRDMRIKHTDQYACFFRDGHNDENCHLIIGSLKKPPTMTQGLQFYANQENIEIVTGFSNIYKRILQLADTKGALGIRDYYEWWSANNESGNSGKLFLIDPTTQSEDTLQIFFDDNIKHHPVDNIVDIRSKDGTQLAASDYLNRHLVRAFPMDAILNRRYFIECVDRCEANWLANQKV